ncbi:YbhB/YbcL family Raf kinase inhibitor-like protein [Gilvimarinus agarilyticus]|uniref:YbhB/YbcL family Raf kinase inhibitor-like protein n=1 Tax=unclassified Gilvimarinus TaxID=2642066 RepID=UPI001C08ACF0|nr:MULTISPECIES: YbhB/YbcL family Raf kinase inhibitor-like protein [unclassified Gilvimarinus]MBU2887450.1 YbhB/YbcL family Raf kinase inhibitor-like protein [Gilvimarinus agarilyticus]MDO6572109.1 YbhB/YbcL family Raf kinase inhibitor-like protein [Gilvimarinus sp. 2_MG-2023]MDO6746170.1 YbhB/YbcL family Raf kinase inhibitor-like protein [Gilvimarinus sp. 1_MG-2023]
MRRFGLLTVLACMAASTHALELHSDDMQEGHMLNKAQEFNGFGCSGDNISPHLKWTNLPEGTKSVAVTAYDPDAPTGSGWWHWLVVNLPVDTASLPAGISGKLKKGLEVETDYGTPGFGGACPPVDHGMHRYQFTVWALNTSALDVSAETPAAVVGYKLNSAVIAKDTLTATYAR